MEPPLDFQYRWTIDDIGLLNVVAFEQADLALPPHKMTLTCWIYPTHLEKTQVIINRGNRALNQPGWSLLINAGKLVARVNLGEAISESTAVSLPAPHRWYHVAIMIDRELKLIRGFLNGASKNWLSYGQKIEIIGENLKPDDLLVIGGYTDSAGGHFDHTFGRRGSGLVDDVRIYPRLLTPPEISSFFRPDNATPSADFQIQISKSKAPTTVRFDASASHDSDGRIINYLWDFGDGQTGSGQIVTHHYAYAGRYTVQCTVIDNDHGQATAVQTFTLSGAENPLKHTPVFVNGTEGHACYRIPAIVRAVNGDLLAFAEGRVAGCSDSTPVIHIVCKRSLDNGRTWGPVQIVARNFMGENEHACMNPSPVVDTVRGTGRIFVVFLKQEHSEWEIVEGKGLHRVFCIESDDHGRSWTHERDITLQVHKPYNPDYTHVYADAARPENKAADWRKQTPTLGHAIQLQMGDETRGRLFFIGSRTTGAESVFNTQGYAFWSDDLGHSWQIGEAIESREDGSSAKGLNEATAVELDSGAVMINSRNYQQQKVVGHRAVAIGTFDENGNIHFQPVYHDTSLVDSGVQASIMRYSFSSEERFGRKNRILFSNPDHPQARVNLTVRLSYDEGKSWPISKVIDPGPAAYSDLVIQADNRIGVLYEVGNHGGIAYVTFSLAWLTEGNDTLDKNHG